jgi:hypothetical protein
MRSPTLAALGAALALAACASESSAPAEKPMMRLFSSAADARLPAEPEPVSVAVLVE